MIFSKLNTFYKFKIYFSKIDLNIVLAFPPSSLKCLSP